MDRRFRHHSEYSQAFCLKSEETGRAILFKGEKVLTLTPAESIRDKYFGAVYLLASGPSVNEFDFTLLDSAYAVYMNGSVKKLTKKSSKAFFVVDDADFFENRMDYILQGLEYAETCFFSALGIDFICRHDPSVLKGKRVVLLERVNRIYGQAIESRFKFGLKNIFDPDYFYGSYNPFSSEFGRVGFSLNLEKGVFGGRTIAYQALQVAYHLGFRDMAIAGMDLSYDGAVTRFYEKAEQARPSTLLKDYNRHILPSFKVVQRMVKKKKLSVVNLSLNSRLPSNVIRKSGV